MSWFYVFLHWIPRAWWPGKPIDGMLVDMSFTNGAPYDPGFIGFLFLDGGYVWMLVSCALAGGAIYWMDKKVSEMKDGYFRCCLYGIFIVNSLLLPRGCLHFQVYAILAMVIPCLALSFYSDGTHVGTSRRPFGFHSEFCGLRKGFVRGAAKIRPKVLGLPKGRD
jgi:hypothetical protein